MFLRIRIVKISAPLTIGLSFKFQTFKFSNHHIINLDLSFQFTSSSYNLVFSCQFIQLTRWTSMWALTTTNTTATATSSAQERVGKSDPLDPLRQDKISTDSFKDANYSETQVTFCKQKVIQHPTFNQ